MALRRLRELGGCPGYPTHAKCKTNKGLQGKPRWSPGSLLAG